LENERDKIKAIHDYVVKTLYYDHASLVVDQRKKQDALSTLLNGTGVCEGYTSLTAALLRSAGIPARAVSGDTAGGAHAWNNILVEGSWLFLDSTWDDPYEQGDDSVRHKYYLLTDLTGIASDHTPQDLRIGRGIAVGAPRWRGLPDGWY
ncbi:MAG: transglutaminase-like domain-containing protein, partial [Spirochaetaceae bacterium]|nr:transglutaminase-like domain-containing protein [Spirochaetaceae bacterium]